MLPKAAFLTVFLLLGYEYMFLPTVFSLHKVNQFYNTEGKIAEFLLAETKDILIFPSLGGKVI